MDKMDKPRICEVLGVEVDQPFNIDYPCRAYNCLEVRQDGKVWETGPYPHKVGSNALYYLIEHKDEIILKPRFTQEEVAVLKALQAAGVAEIEREAVHNTLKAKSQTVNEGESSRHEQWYLPKGLLPSLRPGQSVRLEDVLEGT